MKFYNVMKKHKGTICDQPQSVQVDYVCDCIFQLCVAVTHSLALLAAQKLLHM